MTVEEHRSAYRASEPRRHPTPVPYDQELVAGLNSFIDLVEKSPLRAKTIQENRAHLASITPSLESQMAGRTVLAEHRSIPGPFGVGTLEVTVISPLSRRSGLAPGVLGIHGGGYVLGTRFFGTSELIDLAERFGTVGVAVEYRLAPEFQAPAQAEDCFAALEWMAEHAQELCIDPNRVIVAGTSAGGGLAAAVAIMARDRGVKLLGQVLIAPMIDDLNNTVSSWQYDGAGAWDRNNNDTGWDALLGDARGTARVHPYAAPARAIDMSGLAPAYIEVGAAEVFRDEAASYASRIWAAGGDAELHVWRGGYHGFSSSSPAAAVSRMAASVRDSWLHRVIEG